MGMLTTDVLNSLKPAFSESMLNAEDPQAAGVLFAPMLLCPLKLMEGVAWCRLPATLSAWLVLACPPLVGDRE